MLQLLLTLAIEFFQAHRYGAGEFEDLDRKDFRNILCIKWVLILCLFAVWVSLLVVAKDTGDEVLFWVAVVGLIDWGVMWIVECYLTVRGLKRLEE